MRVFVAAGVSLLVGVLGGQAAAQPLTVKGYSLVRERPVSRTVSEYEYRAVLTNGGGTAFPQVNATVISLLPTTKLVDSTLRFNNVPAKGTRASTDTFVIRRPRILPFTAGELVWTISANGDFSLSGYTSVAERRVNALLSDFDYRAVLTNRSASPIAGATATVLSALPTTTVRDGMLSFGNVPAGGSRGSTDTFTLRRLRGLPLNPAILGWTIIPAQGPVNRAPMAAIAPLTGTVHPGVPVTLDGSGSTDPDGTPIVSYLWELLSRPLASQAVLNVSTPVVSFTPDMAGSYSVQLTVSDGALTGYATVAFSTANRAPSAAIAALGSVFVAQVVMLDGTASSDPDGDSLSYAWIVASRPGGSISSIQNATSSAASFSPDRAGPYEIRLSVSDGLLSDTESVAFLTNNSPPVADAGTPQTATVGTTITLDGSRSFDVDGDALTYSWTTLVRPLGSISTPSDATAVMPTFQIDAAGSYSFQLVVRDVNGAVSQPTTVAVSTVNSPPVAKAGPDQAVVGHALVQLSGAASTDADGDTLTYLWLFVQTPLGSTASIDNPSSPTPTFVADRSGTFVVRLTVSDPSGAGSSDFVSIATANAAPNANAGPDQSVVVGTLVQLDGTASTDVDGDPLGYAWSFTSKPPNSTAALSADNIPSPSFTLDVPGEFILQLLVNDGAGGTDVDTVVIATTNSRPTADAGPDQSIIAGRTVTLDGRGSSDPDGDLLTYDWAITTMPAGSSVTLFNPAAVEPTFVADLPGTYIVQLIVSDGALTSGADTVTISTGNTAPVANAGADAARIALGTQVTLDGLGSGDADGHPLAFAWAILSRPNGSTVVLSDPSSPTPSFTPDVGGEYVAQLIVNDGFQSSQPDTTVVRVNQRPVAEAGADRTVPAGIPVSLSGAGSSDPDNDPRFFSWTLVGPQGSAAALGNPLTATPSFVPDVTGIFALQLVVNDGLNDSTPDEVLITVTASQALTLSPSTTNMLTLAEAGLTVTAAQPAGTGGLLVTLSSSDASVADVPSSVTIPQGQTSVQFDATSGAVSGNTTVTASAAGSTAGAATVIVSERLMAISLDAPTVGVGRTLGASVVLAQPAPASGVTIDLASANPAVATVAPASVVVASGGTQAAFSIFGVGLGTSMLSANSAGFTPAAVNVTSTMSLSLGPTPFQVERAGNTAAQVTLSAPAPAGGLMVTLSSDSASTAAVPASVVVAAGQISVDFVVTGVAEGPTTIHANAAGIDPASLGVTVVPPSPALIESSPASGEGAVAVTRETILRFSRVLGSTAGITPQTLFATFGGLTLPTRIHIAPDSKTVTLFYLQTLPASARVRVTLNTDGLVDELGVPLDGNRDGQPGGVAIIDFDTLTLTTLPGTAVVGRVFASQLGDGGVNTPLASVVIYVDGLETTLRTTTDTMGNFRLEPAPVGEFFVHIDGRAATNGVPVGSYYPTVGKKWESKAGRVTTIPDVFLPLIVPGTLQPVSQSQDTVISFPASVLALDPRLSGVQLTVPADSLYSDSGARGGMLGIAPVAPDRIPSPLPPGLSLPLVITVQTDGATNFDRPVPACFPNLPLSSTDQPLPPGAKSALWSFNHDIGDWEIVGPMTVVQDGTLACTDSGVGIRQPGWHGVQRGTMWEYVFNWYFQGVDSAGSPTTWPNPTEPHFDAVSGSFFTEGNEVAGANESEASDNRLAIRRAMEASPIGIAVIGAAGDLLGASMLPGGFGQERQFDHVAIAYIDPTGELRIAELLFSEIGTSPPLPALLGSAHPGSRSLDTFSGAADRVTAVPLDLPLAQAQLFLARIIALTSPGSPYSFTAPNGNTCASVIAQAIRESGIDPNFGRSVVGWNILTPLRVVEFFVSHTGGSLLPSSGSMGPTGPPPTGEILVSRDTVVRFDFAGETGSPLSITGSPSFVSRQLAILPPDTPGYFLAYDRQTETLAGTPFLSGAIGTITHSTIRLQVGNARNDPDNDFDALGDLAESVIGTSSTNPDTDGDGIPDGAEVRQGTNPLDNLAVATGILATADTPGTAVDVAARNDIAVVADSDRGISVLNVAAGLTPVIIAQVDTPGSAQAVAFEDTLVAVANGNPGLAIVDISDPPAARVTHQLDFMALGGGATSVTVAGPTAYVGLSTGKIAAIDLASGTLLEIVDLQSAAVQDLVIDRDTLYVLSSSRLYAIPLKSPLAVSGFADSTGSIGSAARRARLFTGGGTAYATHTNGYNTFDLTNPLQPVLIAHGQTAQFGWKQIVANGSGLGLAAVGPNSTSDGPHNVSLYDISDPTATDRFLTEFDTPGLAVAVSIYNSRGYVADSIAGLQVINYKAFDTGGVPPTIVLESNYPLSGSAQAEEGQVMRLTANVDDDVQVRNVEFFVNGTTVARDGNFPFEHHFVTPLLGAASSFTVRACAFDTGGNQTCTADLTVALVADSTPPTVTLVTPANTSSQQRATIASISATFSETIDASGLTPTTVQVFSAGADGQVGTLDDLLVADGTVSYNAQSATALLSFPSPLPIASYRALVSGSVSDLAGHAIGADFVWTFSIRDDKRWISDASGSWHDAANWSDNEVPQPGDFVLIDRPAATVTVTYSVGALSLNTLYSTEALALAGGDLTVQSAAVLDGGLTLAGGRFGGPAAVSAASLNWTTGSLHGPGTLSVTGSTSVHAGGGKQISDATLVFGSTTTWAPSASVAWTGSIEVINPAGGVWNVGDGESFVVGFAADVSSVANAGTIRKSQGAGTASLPFKVHNSGVVEVLSGTLSLGGAFGGGEADNGTSSGVFAGAPGTTLRLGGTLVPGSQLTSAGTIEFIGEATVGGTFEANASVNQRVTFTGTIGPSSNLTTAGAGSAVFNTPAPVTLSSLTLLSGGIEGTASVTTGSLTWVGGAIRSVNLTVSGVTTVGAGDGKFMLGSSLTFGSSTTWANGAAVTWDGKVAITNPANGVWEVQDGVTFLVGFGADVSTISNAGTIRKTFGSGTASLGLDVNNTGTIEVLSGTLSLGGVGNGVSSGTFTGTAGTTLRFTGGVTNLDATSQVTTDGTVEFNTIVNIAGALRANTVAITNSTTTFTGPIGVPEPSLVISTGAFGVFNEPSPVTLQSLTLSGVLMGTAAVTTGNMAWTGGEVRLPTLRVTGNTSLSGGVKTLSPTTLTLGSSTVWVGGAINLHNAAIINPVGGTWDVQGGQTIVHGSGIPPRVANGGTLRMNGPVGTLTLAGSFENTGAVALRFGGLAAGTQFDTLVVGGAVTLDGSLDVSLTNGFVPASGDSFTPLTYGSLIGQFAIIQGNGDFYTPTYGPATLTLTKQ